MGASQARFGWGSKVADSEPRPLLRVQGAKVALAKVSVASRKVRVQPHFDSAIEKLKMGRGKRAGHWRAVVLSKLHIDDGTGDWSGGTSIPHDDETRWVSPGEGSPALPGDENDFLDYKNNYFNTNRNGIFHYCLLVHEAYMVGRDYTSMAFTPGDDLMLGGTSGLSNSELANVFMHELGHNLGLKHPTDNNDKPSNWKKITSMYTPAGSSSCVNYATNNPTSVSYISTPDSIPDGNEWKFVSEHMGDGLS